MAEVNFPSQFRLRVRTSKGVGTVEKVRDRGEGTETASFLVRLDSGGNPVWAVNDRVQILGFARG